MPSFYLHARQHTCIHVHSMTRITKHHPVSHFLKKYNVLDRPFPILEFVYFCNQNPIIWIVHKVLEHLQVLLVLFVYVIFSFPDFPFQIVCMTYSCNIRERFFRCQLGIVMNQDQHSSVGEPQLVIVVDKMWQHCITTLVCRHISIQPNPTYGCNLCQKQDKKARHHLKLEPYLCPTTPVLANRTMKGNHSLNEYRSILKI